jgi:enoyl-CoA hydratase/carnithine racemase
MTQLEVPPEAAAVVLFEERRTASGQLLGIATLNFEKTLNALSLPMIELLAPRFAAWNARADIAAIVLRGAGDRAFCAGGDIQALYHSMRRNHAAGELVDDYPDRFFAAEYRLDYTVHCARKPVICFGHGVVMGGGLGLFGASRYRLVTERSRIAMPEVTIGLFPDAGASWILKGLATPVAAFLGMTGSHMNAADALHIGLATHAVGADTWSKLIEQLEMMDWRGDSRDGAAIERAIAQCAHPPLADSALAIHGGALADALPQLPDTATAAAGALLGLSGRDPWIDRGLAALRNGCPTSVAIVHEQLRRVGGMSLADTLRMELCVATHCARNPDFAEGVRALIVEKDNSPKWRFTDLGSIPNDYVMGHFEPPWPVHPLANLEEV